MTEHEIKYRMKEAFDDLYALEIDSLKGVIDTEEFLERLSLYEDRMTSLVQDMEQSEYSEYVDMFADFFSDVFETVFKLKSSFLTKGGELK